MNTKLNGDIAEQAVILEVLKQSWCPLIPVGDRLPYDLVIDRGFGELIKIQVKKAFKSTKSKDSYIVSTRRIKTNRKVSIYKHYTRDDFDFAIAFVEELNS